MKKKVLYLYVFTVLIAITTSLAHPVTPAFIRKIGVSEYMFGLFFAAMNLGTLIMSPFWGNLGDIKKRKYIMFFGFIGYGISQALFGYFTNAYYILAVRFLAGVFASSLTVSMLAYIAEDKDITNKKSVIAWFLALTTFGASLSYLLGGILGDVFVDNPNYVLYVQGAMSFVMAFLALFVDTKVHGSTGRAGFFTQMKQFKHISKQLAFLFLIIAIVNIPIANFGKYIDLYIIDLGYKSSAVGYFAFTTGIVTMIVTVILVPFIARKFDPIKSSIVSLVIGGVLSFITFILGNAYLMIYLYSFYMVYVAARAVYEPSIVNHLNEEKLLSSGMLMGLRQSALSLGAVVGPIVAGFIYGYINIGLFYILSATLIVGALLLVIYYFSIKKGSADDLNRKNT